MVPVKRYSQNKNMFMQVIQINWYGEINKHIFVYRERARRCFIQTIQQLFPNHKFKTSMLYTVLVCVCSVFWLLVKALHRLSLLLVKRSPEVTESKKTSSIISPSDYNQWHPDDSIWKELDAKHLSFYLRNSKKKQQK